MNQQKTTIAERLRALNENPYFRELPEAFMQHVAENTSLRAYERGQTVFWEGDECPGLFIVHTGSVKLFRVSPQGRQYIVRVLQEGETFNEVPVFDGGENVVNVDALEPSLIWLIEKNALNDLLVQHPEFARRVIQNLGRNLRGLVRMVSEMAFYQVTHRLARLINELSPDELAGEANTRVTQDQIAARLGTVREVVSRSLRELERSGAIQVANRRIQVNDRSVLEQWLQPWN
jgi:CRP-like cAMP-binding protein